MFSVWVYEDMFIFVLAVIEAREKQSYSKFLQWINDVVFISREDGVEVFIESEIIENMTHWPKGATDRCANCKVDYTLKEELDQVLWKSLQLQPPANVVRVIINCL